MIKFIEAPDLHFSPENADILEGVITRIIETAREEHVDFIALPGDLYDRPLYASDKGGVNILRNLVRKMTAVCPVVAVQGTPSHEPPGALDVLEDVGLRVLKPGREYTDIPGVVLFGIPELNKHTIQAQLGLSAEQANAEAVNLFIRYVTEIVAPLRAKHPDLPAVALLHGVVSDAHRENSSDIVIRSSDIVIHADDLAVANIDRWSLGHIHTPWESQVISAGYAGSWGGSWGEIGFVPGMNVVTLPGGITRSPYGTPKRLKIIQPLSSYDPAIAYWLHSDDPNATLPPDVHPWSRVTFNEQRLETRRVTREQAAEVKTLADLFKLIDPSVSKPVIDKVNTMTETVGSRHSDPVDVVLQSVEISGCTFFEGQTVSFNPGTLPDGVNGIRGNNGAGKSSLLAFCSLYPVVIGKDTQSGRTSAIKDFFDAQDSWIKKSALVNGKKHEHLITIKGAHTQTAKVECYLTIDGIPQLEKGTFDEMFETCERLYGPYNDYLLTTFYVQPLQGKTGSSLMSATMTDIRDLVQSIAGIDRETEKRYALDHVSRLGKEIERLQAWLSGAEEFSVDIPALRDELTDLEKKRTGIIEELQKAEEADGLLSKQYVSAMDAMRNSEAEKKRKTADESRRFELAGKIGQFTRQIEALEGAARELIDNEALLSADDAARETAKVWEDYRQRIADEQRRVDRINEDELREYNQAEHDLERRIAAADAALKTFNTQTESINKPCPRCGYISPDVKAELEKLHDSIADAEEEIAESNRALCQLTQPEEVKPEAIPQPMVPLAECLSDNAREALLVKIKEGREAAAGIVSVRERKTEIEKEIADLEQQTYSIDEKAEETAEKAKAEMDRQRIMLTGLQREEAEVKTGISGIKDKIAKAEEVAEKISKAKADIGIHTTDREHWDYIARMLQPAKIPALELDLVLDSIDAEATRTVEPFLEGRYAFRTETQQQGKAGTVDRFDIKVYDAETGKEKSFIQWNPGHKAFFADAYTKALVRKRNERSQRRYDPIIMDESDGPIQPERIGSYYEIQKKYWTDHRVLVVSHSPASHEYIENTIYMEELKK
jgi:DNA repair exonuclease SbcCD nuclease subunit